MWAVADFSNPLFHAVLTSGACERRSSERLLPGARGLLASPPLLRFMAFAPG